MAGLDDIRTVGTNVRGKCNYCDEDATAHIEVRVRERGGDKKTVTTKTVSACDTHTVILFQDIQKQIEKKR